MQQTPSPRGPRSDRAAMIAGVSLSLLAHVAAFAFVGFQFDRPPVAPEPTPALDFEDHDALRLVELTDADAPTTERLATWAPAAGADAGGAASAGAPLDEPGAVSVDAVDGAAEANGSAPPVLLTFREPTRSPLLLAAAVESAPSAAAVRAASYTPGGVRAAKRDWSGQGETIARRNGRIRAALGVGVGDGHCPTRPPGRGPPGL